MALETQIKANIVAGVDQKSFNDGINFARDTGKKIDQELRKKLELDIAQAQVKLQELRKNLKTAEGDVKIKLQVDTNELQRQLTESKRQLNNLSNTGDASLSRLQAKFNGIGGTIKEAFSSFIGPTAIVAGIGAIGKATFDAVSSLQKYEAVLKNSLGSQQEAQKSLALIRDIAKETPFELNNLTESYIKLVNRGFKPTREEIVKLGDLASSQGKDFNMLVEALLDAQTGEFERLKEFGVKAKASGDQVSFTFKGVTTTVQKTDEAIRNYILGLGQLDGIQGGMLEQSKTLGGQRSNVKDQLTQLATVVGSMLLPIFQTLVSSLSGLIGFLGITANSAREAGERFNLLTGYISSNAKSFDEYKLSIATVGQLSDAIQQNQLALEKLTQAGKGQSQEAENIRARQELLTKTLADGTYKTQDLNAEFERNKQILSSLKSEYDTGKISQEQYNERTKLINEQQEILKNKLGDVYFATKASADANEEYNKKKLDLSASIAELEKYRLKAIESAKTAVKALEIILNQQLKAVEFENKLGGLNAGFKPKSVNQFGADLTQKQIDAKKKELASLEAENTKAIVATNKAKLEQDKVTKKTGGGGGGKSSAVKAKEEEQKRLEELEKKEQERIKKVGEEAGKRANQQVKDDIDKRKQLNSFLLDNAKKTYDLIDKEIDESKKKIEEYNDKIKDTEKALSDLSKSTSTDLATRAVEIEKQLADANTDATERAKLQAELQLATQNTTQEELARARMIAGENETERILRETAEKKAELEKQLADYQDKKAQEELILTEAQNRQKALEQGYTTFFQQQIALRGQALDSLIAKLERANSLGGFSGVDTQALNTQALQAVGGNTNNTKSVVNNVNITAQVNSQANVDKLTKQVTNAITDGSKGIK